MCVRGYVYVYLGVCVCVCVCVLCMWGNVYVYVSCVSGGMCVCGVMCICVVYVCCVYKKKRAAGQECEMTILW